jgi:predicted solute-binding protein
MKNSQIPRNFYERFNVVSETFNTVKIIIETSIKYEICDMICSHFPLKIESCYNYYNNLRYNLRCLN